MQAAYLAPAFFVARSYFVLLRLDFNYERKAIAPQLDSVKGRFYALYAERTARVERLPEP